MRKRYLKKGIKKVLVVIVLGALIINFFSNLDNVTKDDLGNECSGGIIKICSGVVN